MRNLETLVPATEVTLGADGRGSVTASVTLTDPPAERVVLKAVSPAAAAPAGPSPAEPGVSVPPIDAWTTIDRPLRDVTPGVVEQFLVSFDGSSLVAGRYPVLLVPYPADEAPEEYADRGQTVTVVVPPKPAPPPPPKTFPWLLVVIATVVVVVLAAGGWLIFRPRYVTLPNFVGIQSEAAFKQVTDLGFSAGLGSEPGPKLGVINRQEPPAGRRVKKGSDVQLYRDLGATMPNLIGLRPLDAQKSLAQLGLTMIPAPNKNLSPYEQVTFASVKAGSQAPRRIPIVVAVKVEVPNLFGQTEVNAKAILEERGLAWQIQRLPVSPLVGLVYDQGTPAGTLVDPGAQILVDVSSGFFLPN